MKFSNPRYPIQFWSEIIAGIVGRYTGVPVPRAFIATDPKTGEMGSLASWFYGEGAEEDFEELPNAQIADDVTIDFGAIPIPEDDVQESFSRYIPGSSYMVRFIPGYDLEKGKQHNIKTLSHLIAAMKLRHKVNAWPHWAGVLTFDALIGNTDRHQDNWGVLWRRTDENVVTPRFSPAFDNGTSLLHEILEEKLDIIENDARRHSYINRGRHHLRVSADSQSKFRHLELIEHLIDVRPEVAPFIDSVTDFDMTAMGAEIQALAEIDCITPISRRRCEAIIKVIESRVLSIREMLDGN